MAVLCIMNRSGIEYSVDATEGNSVMEIIRNAGLDELLALCGGSCSCATCHIYVDPAFVERLAPMGPDEGDLLDSSGHRRAESRLACQVLFDGSLSGMRVTIAPES